MLRCTPPAGRQPGCLQSLASVLGWGVEWPTAVGPAEPPPSMVLTVSGGTEMKMGGVVPEGYQEGGKEATGVWWTMGWPGKGGMDLGKEALLSWGARKRAGGQGRILPVEGTFSTQGREPGGSPRPHFPPPAMPSLASSLCSLMGPACPRQDKASQRPRFLLLPQSGGSAVSDSPSLLP